LEQVDRPSGCMAVYALARDRKGKGPAGERRGETGHATTHGREKRERRGEKAAGGKRRTQSNQGSWAPEEMTHAACTPK
jgi:hypothetical protein